MEVDDKFRELPYFLDDADAADFDLPLTRALHEYWKDGEHVTVQDKRKAPAF